MRNMERIAVTVCGSCRKKCKDGQRQMERKSVCQTACWDCFRHHRGCDGTRPCNRCKAKNRASSCRDCLPEERIGINKRRRTSRKNAGIPSPRVPWLKKQRIPIQFFIINPQIFMNHSTPSSSQERIPDDNQNESLNFESVRESSKQESFKASEFLNTETNDHNNNHCINSEQPPEYNNNISDLCGSPQTTTPKQCIPPFSAESLCTTQISSTHDLAIQPCQLTQEIADEFEECTRQDAYTHAIPCAFDDFGNQLVRNAYLPFVLHSPLQSFIVFRPKPDFEIIARTLRNNRVDSIATQATFLPAANSAFCDITQYTEEEILGTNWQKLFPGTFRLSEHARRLLEYFLPQPPDMKASPVLPARPYYIARDSSIIHAQARIQFFYSENGLVSFCVVGIEEYRRTKCEHRPFPPSAAIGPQEDVPSIQPNNNFHPPTCAAFFICHSFFSINLREFGTMDSGPLSTLLCVLSKNQLVALTTLYI